MLTVPQARTQDALQRLPSCFSPTDCDGDGFDSIAAGAEDYDDSDATRYLGNVEITNDRDEDCDPSTIAERRPGREGGDRTAGIPVEVLNPWVRQEMVVNPWRP